MEKIEPGDRIRLISAEGETVSDYRKSIPLDFCWK